MAEIKTLEKALSAIGEIAAIKANGADPSTTPDAELSKNLAAALDVVKSERAKIEAERAELSKQIDEAKALASPSNGRAAIWEPRFRGFSGSDPGGRTYDALIRKRAAGPDEALIQSFHRWNDDVILASLAVGTTPERILKHVPEFSEFFSQEIAKQSSELSKALAAATASAGLEWIPTIFSPELVDLIRIERVLVNAFRRYPMKSGTERINQLTQEMSAFVVSESTSNSVFTVPSIISDPGTANVILTAIEMAVASVFSKTFEEDSIVPALPEVRRRIIEGMAKGIEDALINGVASVTHPDSDVSPGQAATAWDDSLRAIATGTGFTTTTATVALDGTNMSADNVLKLKLLQGRFGAVDADSLWLTSPQGLVKLFGLRDANSNQILLRVDTFGARAVLLTGAVASLFGSDVLVSDLVKTNLGGANNLLVPPTPGDKTMLIRFNKTAFVLGDRRNLTIESDTLPLTRQRVLVATERLILRRVKPSQSASDRPVTIGRSIETT